MRCHDCREILERNPHNTLVVVLAVALTGLMVMLIALSFPAVGANFGELQTTAGLLDAPFVFDRQPFRLAGVTLAITTALIPTFQVVTLVWLCVFARARRRAPGFVRLQWCLHKLRPWAMAEVFFLGILVMVAKVSAWVPIVIGPGLWAMAGFTLLLAALRRFDSADLWAMTEPPCG